MSFFVVPLQHEFGEANEFLRGAARPLASHLGPEPILREQLALQGDPVATSTMSRVRQMHPDDALIQKYIRQAGGTADSPIPLGGRQHRAVQKMIDRNPAGISRENRIKALALRDVHGLQAPYVPSDVKPVRQLALDAREAVQTPGLLNKFKALKQVASPLVRYLK